MTSQPPPSDAVCAAAPPFDSAMPEAADESSPMPLYNAIATGIVYMLCCLGSLVALQIFLQQRDYARNEERGAPESKRRAEKAQGSEKKLCAADSILNKSLLHKHGRSTFLFHIVVAMLHAFVLGPLALYFRAGFFYMNAHLLLWITSISFAKGFNRNSESFGPFIGLWVVFRNILEVVPLSVMSLCVCCQNLDGDWERLTRLHFFVYLYRLFDVFPRRVFREWPKVNFVVIFVLYGVLFEFVFIAKRLGFVEAIVESSFGVTGERSVKPSLFRQHWEEHSGNEGERNASFAEFPLSGLGVSLAWLVHSAGVNVMFALFVVLASVLNNKLVQNYLAERQFLVRFGKPFRTPTESCGAWEKRVENALSPIFFAPCPFRTWGAGICTWLNRSGLEHSSWLLTVVGDAVLLHVLPALSLLRINLDRGVARKENLIYCGAARQPFWGLGSARSGNAHAATMGAELGRESVLRQRAGPLVAASPPGCAGRGGVCDSLGAFSLAESRSLAHSAFSLAESRSLARSAALQPCDARPLPPDASISTCLFGRGQDAGEPGSPADVLGLFGRNCELSDVDALKRTLQPSGGAKGPEEAAGHATVFREDHDKKSRDLHFPSCDKVVDAFLAMERDERDGAPTKILTDQLNVLASAWIQFQVHDWVDHETEPYEPGQEHMVRLPGAGTTEEGVSREPTEFAPTRFVGVDMVGEEGGSADPGTSRTIPVGRNTRAPFWNASVVYGHTAGEVAGLRKDCADGRVVGEWEGQRCPMSGKGGGGCPFMNKSQKQQKLPRAEEGVPGSEQRVPKYGDQRNSWVGIELLQTLFLKEHNHVAKLIKEENPGWSNERIFASARLVVSGVIAKIHTVDWTCELLKSRTLKYAMHTNWHGLLGKRVKEAFGHFGSAKLSGLVGFAEPQLGANDVPFQFTEEFSAVYRHLHSMLVDEIEVFEGDVSACAEETAGADAEETRARKKVPMTQCIGGRKTEKLIDEFGGPNLLFSMIRQKCGAPVANNYPDFLRNLRTTDEFGAAHPNKVDLAVIDVYRDRERSVKRYNAFRRSLRLPPLEKFADLTTDFEALQKLHRIYGEDNVEELDLSVGCLLEQKPRGFAISNTAFEIFVVMASRRLETDAFFTRFFSPQFYSKVGMAHLNSVEGLMDVLQRHEAGIFGACLARDRRAVGSWERIKGFFSVSALLWGRQPLSAFSPRGF